MVVRSLLHLIYAIRLHWMGRTARGSRPCGFNSSGIGVRQVSHQRVLYSAWRLRTGIRKCTRGAQELRAWWCAACGGPSFLMGPAPPLQA
jgi:hypothetical protein